MLRIVGVFKKCATFATANEKRLVPWMSGLVSGLQNRVRRFESARNLLVIENSVLRIENYFYF